jgi:hypothetical protein
MRSSVSSFIAATLMGLSALAAVAEPGPANAAEAAKASVPARPIVAGLFAEPDKYLGTRIEIYGLVIAADPGRRTFQLQDVSQRPLTVDARRLPRIVAGDQVEILGELQSKGGSLVLVGLRVKHVKVLAGGGCC